MHYFTIFLFTSWLLQDLALGVPMSNTQFLGRDESIRLQKRIGKDRLYANIYCTEEQKAFEAQAWEDALIIGDALGQWSPRGHGQQAVDLYLGTDSSQMSIWDQSWFDILRRNIQGALSVHDNIPPTRNVFVFCSEPPYIGYFCNGTGSPTAYTYTDRGTFYDNHYMVFCPKFYNADTLHAALEKANNGTYDVTKVQPFSRTSGATYYHESLHWVGLTSTYAYPVWDSPDGTLRGKPKLYNSVAVAAGAKTYNTAGMVHVSDAYALAGLAILVQDFFKLPEPPGPDELATRDIASDQLYAADDGPPPYDNETRPAELPDPNTPDNKAIRPFLTLPAALAGPPSADLPPAGQAAASTQLTTNPKVVAGTS